jgi:hypothetical protein
LRFQIDNYTSIETDCVESLTQDVFGYAVGMVSGNRHLVDYVVFQSLGEVMKNKDRVSNSGAY